MTPSSLSFFFFNDPATPEIYTLSLHDALPISPRRSRPARSAACAREARAVAPRRGDRRRRRAEAQRDRKSTRLNSSHPSISYAVFCLKKKKINNLPYCKIGADIFPVRVYETKI